MAQTVYVKISLSVKLKFSVSSSVIMILEIQGFSSCNQTQLRPFPTHMKPSK